MEFAAYLVMTSMLQIMGDGSKIPMMLMSLREINTVSILKQAAIMEIR